MKRPLVLSLLAAGLLALLPASIHAAATSLYNVKDYGATGDGKTLDSPAIDKAIDAAAGAGGGTVFVPAGTYLSGSIHMKSNITLYLDNGAKILGAPQNMNAYDPCEEFDQPVAHQDGGHTYFHNSLIWGENLTNIAIIGNGMIDGGGLVRGDAALDRMSGFNIWERPGAKKPAHEPLRLGNKAIAFKKCRHVTMRDFTIFHGGHFAILVTGCDDMTVDNVTMDTNRDGIDIDCCRNTVVSNCRINSPSDDGLCPKSTFALGENRPCENITITNCQVSGWVEGTLLDGTMKPSGNGTGRIKFGTEANGGFRNITISNCTFRDCRGLALEEVDGGIIENITINNLTMINVNGYAIYATLGERNRGPDVKVPSRMKNVLISNVVATNVTPMSGIQIMGLPQQPIENFRLENIRLIGNGDPKLPNDIEGNVAIGEITPRELGKGYPEPSGLGTLPAYGVYARHVKGLELSNIRVSYEKPDPRPALILVDVDDVTIDDFRAKLEEGTTAARFEKVTNDVIRTSPVLEKAGAIVREDAIRPATPRRARQAATRPATAPAE